MPNTERPAPRHRGRERSGPDRSAPAPAPAAGRRSGRRWAAFVLILLAPACAELTFGAAPLHLAWLMMPLLVPMYGAGVLLIRELNCRFGGGWPGLLLLGVVYELVEDGIGLQALSSSQLYGAAEWGPRVLGINTTYWVAQLGYHLAFSVFIPVLLTDLLFPRHRDRPYLRRGGLVGIAVCAVLGVALVRLAIPTTQDPGYQAPVPLLAGIVLVCAVLTVLALRVLPGRTPPVPARRSGVPVPALVGVLSLLTTVAFLRLLLPFGGRNGEPRQPVLASLLGADAGALVAMTLAAAIAVSAGWLVYRWSAATDWTDGHRIWLAGGALVGHTCLGAAILARTTFDQVGLLVLAVLTVALLALLARRTANRLPTAQL